MHYKSFEITNFKGIRKLTLELDVSLSSPIVTLVGLNESGKTTVLEALNFFYEDVSQREEVTISQKINIRDSIHVLIPKRLRDNFNDVISLKATLALDESDKRIIHNLCRQEGFTLITIGDELIIEHVYQFKNSKYVDYNDYWNITLTAKKMRTRKVIDIGPDQAVWDLVTEAMEKRLPPVIYYPNFLFDFPDKIFLQESTGESPEQKFYRRLVQDVLDSLANNLNINEHLVARAESSDDASFEALESVINKMGSRIGSKAFDPKLSVFSHTPTSRSIRVIAPRHEPGSNLWYIEIKLKDGDDTFYIRERSLGFRWFFTFLIFTQFRVQRTGSEQKPLFLFDEPASNLHQTAQQRLLQAFKDLASQYGAKIIYTTHSHHLIEPIWLEGTYIVRNQALSYENDASYTSAMTDISIVKYRKFVAEHPDQRTYYQPILDVLEYRPSNLESVPQVIMLEGKNDFYAISYMNNVVLNHSSSLRLLPGGGAGSLDTPIQLYYAWGRDFHVLLDSDNEGKKQKRRYEEKFGKIIEGRLHTIGDILPEMHDNRIEELFEERDRLGIQKMIDPNTSRFNKRLFFLALQECLVCNKKVTLSDTTCNRFQSLINAISGMFQKESGV